MNQGAVSISGPFAPARAKAAKAIPAPRPLTDAELAQYARWTAKRPLICAAVLVALPFVGEGLCRLLGAW